MLKFELTADDYVAANFLTNRWTRATWIRVVTAGVVLTAFVLWKLQSDPLRAVISIAGYIAALSFLMLVARYVYLPWRARRAFTQTKALQRPYQWSWDDEQLSYKTDLATGIVPWSNLATWRESETMFALYASTVAFFLFPKRAFPSTEAVDAFRATLAKKIISPAPPEAAF